MLKPGLYEQVISKELDTELSNDTNKLCQTVPIDSGEASKILAKYLNEITQKGLDNIRDNGGDLSAQVELTNKIVLTIMNETKEADFDALTVAKRAEQLLALLENKISYVTKQLVCT